MTENILLPHDKILEFKAKIFKIIGDANRIKILEILRHGENCQCEIIPLIDQSQPTVSRHLKLLETAGLIKSSKEGTKTFYSIVDPHVFNILDTIDENMIELISNELAKNIGL